jgi:hypothetical protein
MEADKGLRKSFWLYTTGSGRWSWVVLGTLILGNGGLIASVWGYGPQHIPVWAWYSLIYLTLLLGPFIAFHRLRVTWIAETEKAKEEWELERRSLKKDVDDLKKRLSEYDGFDMNFGDVINEFDVIDQQYAARIAVSHNGKRSAVGAEVKIDAFAPISKDEFVTEICRSLSPVSLWPKHCDKKYMWTPQYEDHSKFEIHRRAPVIVDVAFLIQRQADEKPVMIFGPRINNSAKVPLGDYIVVLLATGHHGNSVWRAYTVGDADDKSNRADHIKRRLVIKPLMKSIGSVLGVDHPLAKGFDHKIVLPHPSAS